MTCIQINENRILGRYGIYFLPYARHEQKEKKKGRREKFEVELDRNTSKVRKRAYCPILQITFFSAYQTVFLTDTANRSR